MAWAAARMHLSGAYLENSAGDRKGNLEQAIAALEDALAVLTREANPQEWAAAQMKLGMAYREHLAGNRSENTGFHRSAMPARTAIRRFSTTSPRRQRTMGRLSPGSTATPLGTIWRSASF